ncbi:MAG: aldolase [Pirellulales bacterium]|nr:aldolase [Pirellulales bacterium]
MRASVVKAKLARNEPVLATCLHLSDPSVYEMASLMGFDCLWLDLEHHSHTVDMAGQLMRAARVGAADVMARPGKGEFMRMCRLLELGAQGILYPRCETAAEAAEVVRWCKFGPLGTRGIDGASPDNYCALPIAEYIRAANAQTFVAIQIEDPIAVENVEAIARVPGVDVLFIGTADLSILSGIPGEFEHPRLWEQIERVAAAAKSAGIHWGTPSFSLEHAQRLMKLGARFIAHGCDIVLVQQALRKIQNDFGPLGFQFDNRLFRK